MRRYLAAGLLLALVLAAWQGLVSSGLVDRLLLASPAQVAGAMADDWPLLLAGVAVTGVEVVLGLILAVVLGMA
ncbi:MAG: hypothetical protein QOG62_1205, partial [Thermoleophilaceae bacterium]|nr:hypothetical protein [Thermoleophilaceae bacterium]